jgi:hypothetical protein
MGSHQLLILDDYKIRTPVDFRLYCKDNKIITICRSLYLSCLLQPLDAGCVVLMKKAYARNTELLVRNKLTCVSKLEFLLCFRTAFDT